MRYHVPAMCCTDGAKDTGLAAARTHTGASSTRLETVLCVTMTTSGLPLATAAATASQLERSVPAETSYCTGLMFSRVQARYSLLNTADFTRALAAELGNTDC